MSKGFKIFFTVVSLIAVGFFIPILSLPYRGEPSISIEVRKSLSKFENLLVLKIANPNKETLPLQFVNKNTLPLPFTDPEMANLYTFFGLKYGTVKKTYSCSDLDFCTYQGIIISRFWTKKDIIIKY